MWSHVPFGKDGAGGGGGEKRSTRGCGDLVAKHGTYPHPSPRRRQRDKPAPRPPPPLRPAATHASPSVRSGATNCVYFLITTAPLSLTARCPPGNGRESERDGGWGREAAAGRRSGVWRGGGGGGGRLSPAAGGSGGRARRGQHGSRGGSGSQGNPTQRSLLAEAGFCGPQRNPTSIDSPPPVPVPQNTTDHRRPAPAAGLPPASFCAAGSLGAGRARRPAPSRRAGPGSSGKVCLGRSCPAVGEDGRSRRRELGVGRGAGAPQRRVPAEGVPAGRPAERGEAGRSPGTRPAPAVAAPAPARRRWAHE